MGNTCCGLRRKGNVDVGPELDRVVDDLKPSLRRRAKSDLYQTCDGRPFNGENWRKFVYEALDRNKRQIRLLELLPSSEAESDPSCNLVTIEIGQHDYEAISYVWGEPSNPLHMVVNNYWVKVGRNPHTALRYLRYNSQSRFLWLDALCINQQDVQERNHQVTLMGQVFRWAQGVVYWLGGPHFADAIYLQSLQGLADAYNGVDFFKRGMPADVMKNLVQGVIKNVAEENWPRLTDTHNFLQNEFWRRLWIVQEILLPGQRFGSCDSSVIQVGVHNISWNDFCRAIILLCRHERNCSSEGLQIVWSPEQYLIESVPALVGLFPYAGRPLEMELLLINAHTKATDPRDRIYGLLSWIGDLKLEPRYDHSVEDVYKDAAFALFYGGRSLYLLIAANSGSSKPDSLPSWALDWREGEQAWSRLHRFAVGDGYYNANYGQNAGILRDHDALKVAAIQLTAGIAADRLGAKLEYPKDRVDRMLFHCLHQLSDVWKFYVGHWKGGHLTRYSTLSELEDDLQRTVKLDRDDELRRRVEPQNNQSCRETFLDPFFRLLKLGERSENACRTFLDILHDVDPTDSDTTISWLSQLTGIRFAISPCGRICVLPSCSEAGDCIFVVAGCCVPLLLRPVETDRGRAYINLGGVYLRGMMDGEAVFDSPKRVSTGDPDAYDTAFEEEIWIV